MNILITGGAGFIGSNLAINLNNRGHNVTILDNLQPQIHTSNPDKNSPLFYPSKMLEHLFLEMLQIEISLKK